MHLGTLNLWYKAASYKPKFIVPQMYFMITRKTPWLLPPALHAAPACVRTAAVRGCAREERARGQKGRAIAAAAYRIIPRRGPSPRARAKTHLACSA